MDVSVVIVSFNVKDLLKACIDSIFKQTKGVDFEIIVVDNASTDGSAEMLKGIKGIKIILAKENLGFTKGNNLGIKEAKGKYILVLNPDTEFLENTLKTMVDWMEGHQDVAVSSCQLVDFEHKILPTGGYFPTLPRLFFWALFMDDLPGISQVVKSYHPKRRKYDKEFYPDWVTGSFFFVRKTAMDKVGMFDENIFMYGDEVEWCMRFKAAGFQVAYTPVTKIVHLERRSSGGSSRNAVLGEYKGLRYIYGKYYPGWKQVLVGTLLDVGATLRVLMWAFRLKPQMAKIYFEALLL